MLFKYFIYFSCIMMVLLEFDFNLTFGKFDSVFSSDIVYLVNSIHLSIVFICSIQLKPIFDSFMTETSYYFLKWRCTTTANLGYVRGNLLKKSQVHLSHNPSEFFAKLDMCKCHVYHV